jgi:hypothetical protein
MWEKSKASDGKVNGILWTLFLVSQIPDKDIEAVDRSFQWCIVLAKPVTVWDLGPCGANISG